MVYIRNTKLILSLV